MGARLEEHTLAHREAGGASGCVRGVRADGGRGSFSRTRSPVLRHAESRDRGSQACPACPRAGRRT
eukprot:13913098-Heterocapsa_arctica.AAC.1